MDGMPSRRVSFSLQVEETTTDDEILLDNHHHDTCDSMNGEWTGQRQSLLVKVFMTAASFSHGPGVFQCLYHVHTPFALITQ